MDGTALVSNEQSLAAMRRTFGHMQLEIIEFQQSASANGRDGMERARVLAHGYLDAYLDAMHSAFMIADKTR